jgi:MarR family transcriptional regulator, lower aerobic nicotinate degradation pathway regulator
MTVYGQSHDFLLLLRKRLRAMAEMKDMPGHLIRRAQQVSNAIFAEQCGAFDLTSVQYAALFMINAHDGIDATRLSGLIAFDRSTIGDVLERLETKGWIVRAPGPSDKRIKRLHASDAGKELLTKVEPAVRAVQTRLLEPLTEHNRLLFLDMLRQIADSPMAD